MTPEPESTASDAQLVAQYLDGDARAFEAIVRRHRRPLYAYLARFAESAATADDLFQDTFLKVLAALPGYREQGRFSAWLFGIAHRLAVDDWRRRKGRHAETDVQPEEVIGPGPPPDRGLESAELVDRIAREVARLPEPQRRVFLLRQETDLKFREIADITGEPLNTVLSHMRYAVTSLRRRLSNLLDDADPAKEFES